MTYIGTSIVECQDKFNATLLVLQLAGWNIQPEKNFQHSCPKIILPLIDHRHCRNEILCVQRKNRSSELHAKDCLHNISQNISFKARVLASLLGKMNALAKSDSNFEYMCRETQHL